MERYSANFSLIPSETDPGKYHMWVSLSLWQDGRCTKAIPVFDRGVEDFPEGAEGLHPMFAFLIEAADLNYQYVTQRYAELCRLISEVNARPASASTNERVLE